MGLKSKVKVYAVVITEGQYEPTFRQLFALTTQEKAQKYIDEFNDWLHRSTTYINSLKNYKYQNNSFEVTHEYILYVERWLKQNPPPEWYDRGDIRFAEFFEPTELNAFIREIEVIG